MNLSPQLTQRIAWVVLWMMGLGGVFLPIFIVVYVLIQGLPAISLDFFTTEPAGGLSGDGGISSVLVTTLWLVGATLVVTVPLGIGAALYLAEYARDTWFTEAVRRGVELLAGIPSIVFGLFGLALFVQVFDFGLSIIAGAFTLACLLLPFMIRSTEEAMRTVPKSNREAALALGATKWQMIRTVVLPGALPGILTGIILCAGGAVAESACLYVVMGGSAEMPESPMDGGRPLAVHIFYLINETNALDKGMATGAVLMVFVLLLNMATRVLSWRYRARVGGNK